MKTSFAIGLINCLRKTTGLLSYIINNCLNTAVKFSFYWAHFSLQGNTSSWICCPLSRQEKSFNAMATKYHTLWAQPCTVGRKSLDVYRREGIPSQEPSTPLVLGPMRRLTAVKEVLYNPCLPTLRRMDMDEVLRKLTDEHSRHSTPCSKGDYELLSSFKTNAVVVYLWQSPMFPWQPSCYTVLVTLAHFTIEAIMVNFSSRQLWLRKIVLFLSFHYLPKKVFNWIFVVMQSKR